MDKHAIYLNEICNQNQSEVEMIRIDSDQKFGLDPSHSEIIRKKIFISFDKNGQESIRFNLNKPEIGMIRIKNSV